LFVGFLAELLFNRVTRRWHRAGDMTGARETLGETLKALFKRLCRDIAGVMVFLLVAWEVGVLLTPPGLFAFSGIIVVNLISISRMGAALSRFMLAPAEPGLRLLNADDGTARYLHRHNIVLLLLAGLSMMLFKFNDMNGVMAGESRLGFWLALAVVLYVIAIIWRARHGLVAMMRGAGADVSPSEAWVAGAYPWFGMAVTVGTWLLVIILASLEMFALVKTAPHYKMMILLLLAPLFDTAVRGLVRHLAPPMAGEGQIAVAAYLSTKRSYIRVGRLIVFGLVIVTIAKVWGIEFANLAAAGVGVQFAAKMIEIFIILAAGYLVWELVSLWINRKLATEQTALVDRGFQPYGRCCWVLRKRRSRSSSHWWRSVILASTLHCCSLAPASSAWPSASAAFSFSSTMHFGLASLSRLRALSAQSEKSQFAPCSFAIIKGRCKPSLMARSQKSPITAAIG
jgi:hypothetical protein